MKVVFTKSTGFVAWAIRLITGAQASHVALQLDDGMFLQADQGGVQLSDRAHFLLNGERTIIALFEPKPNTAPLIDLSWGHSKIGSDYDYLGLVGDLIPMMTWRWFHEKIGDPFGSASKYWCSEFVACLDTGKAIPEFQKFNPRTVSPGQLLDSMRAGASFTELPLS